MYHYISWQNSDSKIARETYSKIKNQLAAGAIDGEYSEVSNFMSAKQAAATAQKKGAKTIVAIGDDSCFNAVIDGVASGQNGSAVGFIPLTHQASHTANLLGIGGWKDSLAILSARKLHDFTLLSTKNGYILSHLKLTIGSRDKEASPIEFVFDDQLTIKAVCHDIEITNLKNQDQPHPKKLSVEARATSSYRGKIKESFINLPHLLKSKPKEDQVLFRLLADEVKIDPKGNSFNEYDTDQPSQALEIGSQSTTIRVIVKKHHT